MNDKIINKINEENPYKKLKFIINIKPEPYARPRSGRGGFFYNPKDKYKRNLSKLIKSTIDEDFNIIEGPIDILRLEFGIIAPKTIINSKVKTELAKNDIIRPITRPDTDNYIKPVLDAMNKIVYTDDSLITSVSAKKVYVFNENEQYIKVFMKYRQLPIKLR